jgi:hypothetical protein
MGHGWGRRDIGRAGAALPRKKVETTMMHQAMVALLFMVIVMFPCFFSAVAGE